MSRLNFKLSRLNYFLVTVRNCAIERIWYSTFVVRIKNFSLFFIASIVEEDLVIIYSYNYEPDSFIKSWKFSIAHIIFQMKKLHFIFFADIGINFFRWIWRFNNLSNQKLISIVHLLIFFELANPPAWCICSDFLGSSPSSCYNQLIDFYSTLLKAILFPQKLSQNFHLFHES